MSQAELGRILGEGYICDGVVNALEKGTAELNDSDRASLGQGVQYLEDALEAYRHTLTGPMDEFSVERAHRCINALEALRRIGISLGEVEGKLESYSLSLLRFQEGATAEGDQEVLEEQRNFFRTLGLMFLVKASDATPLP